MFKKVARVVLIGLTSVLLTSCSIDDMLSGYADTITTRLNWNREQLTRLYNAGLMSDNTYNEMSDAITKRINDWRGRTDIPADVTAAIVAKCTKIEPRDATEKDEDADSDTDDDTDDATDGGDNTNEGKIAEYLKNCNNSYFSLGGGKYNIFADKSEQELNKILETNIYTINMSEGDLSDIIKDVDVIKECQKAKSGLDSGDSEYGNAVKHLYANTEDSKVSVAEYVGQHSGAGGMDFFVDTKHQTFYDDNNKFYTLTNDANNDTNYDPSEINDPEAHKDLMLYSDNNDSFPVVALRLHEINDKAIDALLDVLNSSQASYLVVSPQFGNKETRIIKLVYPVNYVKSISWDGNNAYANIATSDFINVNIYTCKIELNKKSNRLTELERNTQEAMLNVVGTYNKDAGQNNSSLVTLGKMNVAVLDKTTTCTGILLRDYLEYSYMPGLMGSDENFVALGRRVRLKALEIDPNDPSKAKISDLNNFAEFIDRKGTPIAGADAVSVNDLLDYRSGSSGHEQTAIVLSSAKPDGAMELQLDDGTNDGTGITTNPDSESNKAELDKLNKSIGNNSVAEVAYNPIYKASEDAGTTNTGILEKAGVAVNSGVNAVGNGLTWAGGTIVTATGDIVNSAGDVIGNMSNGVANVFGSNSLMSINIVSALENEVGMFNFYSGRYTVDNGGVSSWTENTQSVTTSGASTWTYTKEDGSLAKDEWLAIPDNNDVCHFFHFTGTVLDVNTKVNGYPVDESGRAHSPFGSNALLTLTTPDVVNSKIVTSKDSNTKSTSTSSSSSSVDEDLEANEGTGLYKTEYSSTIYPIVTFPFSNDANSVYVDKADGSDLGTDNSVDVFYGIFVNADLNNSMLYSGWIKGEDQESGNLAWWNNWLSVNKYNYRIDERALEEWLEMNLADYVFAKDKDTIILNVKTLEVIQNKINKTGRINFVNLVRGFTIILGFLAIIDALLLLAAWAIDTQFSFSFKLMPIISFGKCVAVTDADEMASVNTRDIKYLTFSGVLARALIMIMLGAFITLTDVITTLGKILSVVMTLVDFFIGMITGR